VSFSALLNTTASAYRNTMTQNDMGANVRTATAIITSFRCRIGQVSATERAMAGGTGVELTHRLFKSLETGAYELAEGDEVRVGTVIYDVMSVNNPDGMGHHLEADLRERRPDRHG